MRHDQYILGATAQKTAPTPFGVLSKFVAFFVPFWFLSNMSGAVTEFNLGLVNYHSYLFVAMLYIMLLLLAGQSRFILSQEAFRYTATYAFFILLCLCSVITVSATEKSIDQFMSYAWMSLISVGFIVSFKNIEAIRYIFWGVFLALIVVCSLNTIEFLNPDFRVYATGTGSEGLDIVVGEAARISGIYPNQNLSAYAIAFSLFLLSQCLPRLISIPIILIAFFPVMVTFSRAGIVAWALVLFFTSSINNRGKISAHGFLLSLGLLSLLTISILNGQLASLLDTLNLQDSTTERMGERISGNIFNQGDSSTQGRKLVALTALNVFFDNPIFGIGLGGFHMDDADGTKSHNMFLQLASELGIFGVISYLLFLAIPFVQKYPVGMAYSILIVFVSMFNHSLLSSAWFAITTAIVMVILPFQNRLQKERRALIAQTSRKRRRRHNKKRSLKS